uniref:Uncharacterized protein n=1 Tax=Arundo donax TaxID=35708 RepID=A0A0A9GIG8_ARUDO
MVKLCKQRWYFFPLPKHLCLLY